jgi:hypothetical protein
LQLDHTCGFGGEFWIRHLEQALYRCECLAISGYSCSACEFGCMARLRPVAATLTARCRWVLAAWASSSRKPPQPLRIWRPYGSVSGNKRCQQGMRQNPMTAVPSGSRLIPGSDRSSRNIEASTPVPGGGSRSHDQTAPGEAQEVASIHRVISSERILLGFTE